MLMASTPFARRLRHLAPVLSLAFACASPALAQGNDSQQAEALFREGREAVDRGDYTTGCTKFAASLRLTQRASPLLNLANCEEHQGRLVSALAHWTEGIALLPKGDERIESSRQRVEALGRRIPRLTIVLAPSPPPGTKVTLDGAQVSPAALGVPQPIDLGEHTLVASAAGFTDGTSTLVLAEGERREITVTPGIASVPVPVVVKPPPTEVRLPPEAPASMSGLRSAGFVIGGVGLASLAVGAVTGILAISKKDAVEKACKAPTGPCLAGTQNTVTGLENTGRRFATISTVSFIVGAVGLGASVTLVILGAPRKPPTTATLTPLVTLSGGGLAMEGSF
jgi:hypothetical protein